MSNRFLVWDLNCRKQAGRSVFKQENDVGSAFPFMVYFTHVYKTATTLMAGFL